MEAGQPRAAMATPKPAATLDKSAMAPPARKQTPSPKIHYPFWFGGSASSMAACVTHPLDLGIYLPPSHHHHHRPNANRPPPHP